MKVGQLSSIVGITYRLGNEKLSASEVVAEASKAASGQAVDPGQFVDEKALRWVYVEPSADPEPLLRSAVGELLERFPVAHQIETVIYGGQIDHDSRGAIPFKLAHEIGVPSTCRVMWHFVGCGTALSAVDLAANITAPESYALILLNCVVDTSVHPRVMADMLCGDAVMAILLGPGDTGWSIRKYATSNLLKNHSFALVEGVSQDSLEVLAAGVDHVKAHHPPAELARIDGLFPVFNGFANWSLFSRRLGIDQKVIRTDNTYDGAHIDSIDPVRAFADYVATTPRGIDTALLYAQTLGNTFHTLLLERNEND
ncbi:hypothetical protein [Gordonia sp. VNK21]|uniref:hypothetical protein n=1 Tax=Gordonia sp. VNK21 TaxID=3382483 RepID=UPI0038D4A4C0